MSERSIVLGLDRNVFGAVAVHFENQLIQVTEVVQQTHSAVRMELDAV